MPWYCSRGNKEFRSIHDQASNFTREQNLDPKVIETRDLNPLTPPPYHARAAVRDLSKRCGVLLITIGTRVTTSGEYTCAQP